MHQCGIKTPFVTAYFGKLTLYTRYTMLQVLAIVGLCLGQIQTPSPTPGHPVLLPSEFWENRFVVTPVTTSGRKLRLFTDSAGSLILVTEVAHEINLPVSNGNLATTPWPTFSAKAFIPPAAHMFRVWSRKETDEEFAPEKVDGMLGQQWFASRTWTFDYPRKRLYWRAPGDLPKHAPEHEVKLGFSKNAAGMRQSNFATIQIQVDGENILFTLDTGATDILGPEALKQVHDRRPAARATSFLGRSVFDRWHSKHPDWRVVTVRTATGQTMIEVPKVTIGGFEVGPVWFSVQSDKAFHEYMAQWTDHPTEGSIGGSAFKYFRMTVDWPNAVAVFERP